jgi:hypothetical protein
MGEPTTTLGRPWADLYHPLTPIIVLDLLMDLHRETRYAADPQTVFEMLTHKGFIQKRAEAAHAIRHEVTVERLGGGCRTRAQQTLPAEVPDFVRRLVGQHIELDEVITWGEPASDGSRRGDLQVSVTNAPVSLKGTIQLVPSSDGTTRQIVDAELKASVPLIGRKIEEAAAPAVLAGLDGMEELGRTWLSGTR